MSESNKNHKGGKIVNSNMENTQHAQHRKEDSRGRRMGFQKKNRSNNNMNASQSGGNHSRKNTSENYAGRERGTNKSHQRENIHMSRSSQSYQNSIKSATKSRALETVEDIRQDIGRIEKEIELEISEIRSLRLGI